MWIGLTDLYQEGKFEWHSGSDTGFRAFKSGNYTSVTYFHEHRYNFHFLQLNKIFVQINIILKTNKQYIWK